MAGSLFFSHRGTEGTEIKKRVQRKMKRGFVRDRAYREVRAYTLAFPL